MRPALLALAALAACADPAPPAEVSPPATPTVVIDSVVVAEPRFEAAVRFPQIADAVAAEHRAVNAAIRDSAEALVARFRSYADDAPDALTATVTLDAEPVDADVTDRLLSAVWSLWHYTGGAHGNTEFVPLTYDLRTGEPLAPADLFADGAPWADTLAARTERGVVATLVGHGSMTPAEARGILYPEGLDQIRAGDVVLSVGADSVVVHVPPYMLAAYAAGSFRVPVERAALAPFARPGGALGD